MRKQSEKTRQAVAFALQPGNTLRSAARKYQIDRNSVRDAVKKLLSASEYRKQLPQWVLAGRDRSRRAIRECRRYSDQQTSSWLARAKAGQSIAEIARSEGVAYLVVYRILQDRYDYRPGKPGRRPADAEPTRKQVEIGLDLRRRRESRGWTLDEAASRVGVTRKEVAQWESGYGVGLAVKLALTL
jgi:transposase-like protein